MDIFIQILTFVLGLVILIKGADCLVEGASGVARKLRISEAVIGATIIVFGTSAPEIFVAMQSFQTGATDIILGDVIGCSIADIFLLLGISALIRPVKIKKDAVELEIPFYLFVTIAFSALICAAFFTDGEINRIGGIALLVLYGISLFFTLSSSKKGVKTEKRVTAKSKRLAAIEKKRKPWVLVMMLLVGLAAVVFGSDMVVGSAKTIALDFGVSERVIAIGIVAIGTALPELTTAIFASKRGEQDLLIGNSIGSNIFDICFVLGLPILIFGGLSVLSFNIFDLVMMVAAAIILFVFTKEDRKISKKEGIIMLCIFAAYYIATFLWT